MSASVHASSLFLSAPAGPTKNALRGAIIHMLRASRAGKQYLSEQSHRVLRSRVSAVRLSALVVAAFC
jgi:hypothetical protein